MPELSDTKKGIAYGFVAGVATAAGVYALYKQYKLHTPPNKQSHPRQWAIWKRLDRKNKGWVTKDDIRKLCYRFNSPEHAECLASIMDPHSFNYITFKDIINKFPHLQVMRTAARLKLWHRTVGIGVAGNVAGHMAQAGEGDADSTHATKPTALFTYYLPKQPYRVSEAKVSYTRLENFPVTYATLQFPKLMGAEKVQVEPELGLYADIVYSEDRKRVERLVPRRVAAFNDCSIRVLEGANKLSMKKNWGFASKGISLHSFEIDSFEKGSFVDSLVIVSYLKRAGVIEKYSVDAPCRNYLMFNQPLLDWIVDSMNNQNDTDKWETIFPSLVQHAYPNSTWIACGAGEYTEWGAKNYLQIGDEVVIILYDEREFPLTDGGPSWHLVEASFDDQPCPKGMVDLHQTFVD